MQSFRKKYIYNPDNPIYSSENVKTFNCMNTETKDKKLILLQHLKEPSFVEPSQRILQPIEIPTMSEPFSVYPLVRCVSQIGKVSEPEAMYIIKCLTQSKMKKPMYSVVSSQGICCSDVEGILPGPSPDLFQIAIDLLDIPPNLSVVQKSVVSKEGYGICKAIRNGDDIKGSLQNYGWKQVKKDKQMVTDPEFIVFKGRRKEEGPFGEEYGLAWHNTHGLCRMNYINLSRDGYEQEFYKQYTNLIEYLEEASKQKKSNFLKIYKYEKESKGIKIFSQIANQGSLADYIAKKHEQGATLTERNSLPLLEAYVEGMRKFTSNYKPKGITTLHIKCLFVHNNRITIGQPQLITDKTEKKLRELKNSMDYYAPELKENIILPEKLMELDKEKMDIWSFGILLHKVYAREVPIFDPNKRPVISKEKISSGMSQLITKCLDLAPANRPAWAQINLREIDKKSVTIQEAKVEESEKHEVRLGSRAQRQSEKPKSPEKRQRVIEELEEEEEKKPEKFSDENQKLKQKEEEEEEELQIPVPIEISSRLKKIKLILKIILIMLLYIFVFFRPFFSNSIDILLVRSHYTTTSLHLVDYEGNRLSTTTVLTSDPLFFLQNDISFAQIQDQYQCIDNHFDPIYNPDYSLLTYIQSSKFLALLLTGWLTAIIICSTKAISIWKGGISNRPNKNVGRYWATYIFNQLSLAALLFAHFYIYQFFYFAGATPCLSIDNFTGLEPFFDSSLYLFLSNENGYFQKVFSTLGILSIFLVFSTCFHAWGPKLDQKYFLSIPSILLRIVPFILLLLICRIGVFMLFSPSAINDPTKIIPAIINGSFQGLIGVVPEIFILICIAVEALVELFMHWCERKASESDRLSKLFNLKNKKISIDNDRQKINDMSIVDNSKHNLNNSDQY